MKYLILVPDGAGDEPIEKLGGKTPLQVAKMPVINGLAKRGMAGMVKTIPDGIAPGSDAANLSVMGYDPARYLTGRSPLEAVSIGIDMLASDIALRCNLVTLSGEDDYAAKTMLDYSGEIFQHLKQPKLSKACRSISAAMFLGSTAVSATVIALFSTAVHLIWAI